MSDDLISRQAAIYIAFRSPFFSDSLMEELRALPAAQPKTGRWFDIGSLSCRCSNCGGKNNRESKFCPNCGAKMKGETE